MKSTNVSKTLLGVLFFCWLSLCQAHSIFEVNELKTRSGVTVKLLYAAAKESVATVVLFHWAWGQVGIFPNGESKNADLLSERAKTFLDHGINVVIPDVPSDKRHLFKFRETDAHSQDNAVIYKWARGLSQVPLWAVGHSNGGLSAAGSSAFLQELGPDGVVILSAVSKDSFGTTPLGLAQLEKIKVPVLFIHHVNDGCSVAPYDGLKDLTARLTSSAQVEVYKVEKDFSSRGSCHTRGNHIFSGNEDMVVSKIVDWIGMKKQTR